jgi:hypothetical protein
MRALSDGDKVIVAERKRGDVFIACVIVVSETSSVFELLNYGSLIASMIPHRGNHVCSGLKR